MNSNKYFFKTGYSLIGPVVQLQTLLSLKCSIFNKGNLPTPSTQVGRLKPVHYLGLRIRSKFSKATFKRSRQAKFTKVVRPRILTDVTSLMLNVYPKTLVGGQA